MKEFILRLPRATTISMLGCSPEPRANVCVPVRERGQALTLIHSFHRKLRWIIMRHNESQPTQRIHLGIDIRPNRYNQTPSAHFDAHPSARIHLSDEFASTQRCWATSQHQRILSQWCNRNEKRRPSWPGFRWQALLHRGTGGTVGE